MRLRQPRKRASSAMAAAAASQPITVVSIDASCAAPVSFRKSLTGFRPRPARKPRLRCGTQARTLRQALCEALGRSVQHLETYTGGSPSSGSRRVAVSAMLHRGMASDLSLTHLSNQAVIAEVVRLAGAERQATAQLVAALAELDARRLYLGEGCSSLFTYCTSVLHLSEHAAYSRIEAARAGRRFPFILNLLIQGDVTVTTVGLVAKVLTEENHRDVLSRAVHRSKREVEELVASLRPRLDAPSIIRKLPAPAVEDGSSSSPGPASAESSPAGTAPLPLTQRPVVARPVIAPLAPERFKVQFTVGRDTYDKLRRVQDLMRHSVQNGDPAVVFDRALTALLAELEKAKIASATRPRAGARPVSNSRHIPASVKRETWKRDGGRCAFQGARGRCAETGFLEFHHVRPFAAGGESTAENIELRCRAHNQYEAKLFFDQPLIARERPGHSYGVVNSVWTELNGLKRSNPELFAPFEIGSA